MPLKIVFFEASKLISTNTLLLKHYHRHQGKSVYYDNLGEWSV